MTTIALKIGVACSPSKALSAINSIEGLSQWWTTDTTGSAALGGTIKFRFNGEGPDMEVTSNTDNAISWKCLSGHTEWQGTTVHFDIKEEEETVIYFQHRGWQGETSMFHHCSMKWATFLLSLKHLLDGEQANPYPNDIKVSSLGY